MGRSLGCAVTRGRDGWREGWAQAGDEEPKKLRGAKAVP